MREHSPTHRGAKRGLPLEGRWVWVWSLLAAAAAASCVDTQSLFTEADSNEQDPAPMEHSAPAVEASGPNAGAPTQPDTEGPGVAVTPGPNEGRPPLPALDPTPTVPSAPEEEGPPEPPGDPAESDPAPPAPPAEDEPPGQPRICLDLAEPLLLDFAPTDGATQAFFGDFQSVLSGGTFVYPERGAAQASGSLGLTSDVSGGDWHVSGLVGETSGLGLFFDCQSFDASRFAGVAFRVQGELEESAALTLSVGSAGNDVSREWRIDNGDAAAAPSFGRCTPASTEFDGSCRAARVVVPVTTDGALVVVPFAALAGGSPEPGLNPAEITSLQWSLPAPDAGSAPYAVDLRIDDIRFITD